MVSFRQATVADAAALALLAEYFEFRASTFPADMGEYRTTFPEPGDFEPPAGAFLIVEDEDLAGEAADVGCGGIRRVPPGGEALARFEVKHLWLQPHTRGRGFGRALLAELERKARELGGQELVLDTNASLAAAGGLYRSSGFREVAPYNDNPNANHWFAKTL